jgi:hypothetical protein
VVARGRSREGRKGEEWMGVGIGVGVDFGMEHGAWSMEHGCTRARRVADALRAVSFLFCLFSFCREMRGGTEARE